jgi:hypothetical protein
VIAGGIAHGAGMYLKHRLEGRTGGSIPKWEAILYWICWALLLMVGAGGLVHILR